MAGAVRVAGEGEHLGVVDEPVDHRGGDDVVAEDLTGERGGRNRRVHEINLTQQLGKESVFVRFEDARRGDGWGPAVHHVTVKAGDKVIAEFVPGTDAEKPFLHDAQRSQLKDRVRFADNDRNFTYCFTPPALEITIEA